MKIFISQPMNGLSDEEIEKVKEEAKKEIKKIYSFFDRNGELEIISMHDVPVVYRTDKEPSRLWYLGRAIQYLEDVDSIYFCKGWENSKGCRVEKFVATEYNIGIYYQK
jgi:hypothetical protein